MITQRAAVLMLTFIAMLTVNALASEHLGHLGSRLSWIGVLLLISMTVGCYWVVT